MSEFKKIHGKEVEATSSENGEHDFLGRLFWYTVGETLVPIDELTDFVIDNDITKELLPSEPKSKNAWRRATKELEKEYEDEIDEEDDNKISYLTRREDKDTRHFVKETYYPNKDKPEYEVLIEWIYDNENDYVSWKPMVDDDTRFREIAGIHSEMSKRKEIYENSFTEICIRRNIKKLLDVRGKISLKSSGGVYFIPEEHHELLKDIKKVLAKINEYGKSSFRSELWQVPVVSNSEQRNMIEHGIRKETVSFANQKMKEIKDILKNNKEITMKRYQTLIKELKKVEKRKEDYSEIIGRNLETCDEQVNIMKQQIRKLADNVKGNSQSLDNFTE